MTPDHRRWLGPIAAAELERRLRALPPPDDLTVVAAGQLCAEGDLDAATRRLREQVPPGGRLVFLEHVGGTFGTVRRMAGRAFAHAPGGCYAGRDVPAALRRAGFRITDIERFTMPTTVPILRPWASGVAT